MGHFRLPREISAHLGRGEVPLLTSPTRGLGNLHKASSFSAPLTISQRPFGEPLSGPLRQDCACSQHTPCLLPTQEKAKFPGWELILPPPSPFLCLFLPFTFTQPPLPNLKSFQSDNMWAPCPQAPAGISPSSPTFLLQLHNPATFLTPPPPFLSVDNFLNAAKLPLSVHRPRETAAKSQQLCRGLPAESG